MEHDNGLRIFRPGIAVSEHAFERLLCKHVGVLAVLILLRLRLEAACGEDNRAVAHLLLIIAGDYHRTETAPRSGE